MAESRIETRTDDRVAEASNVGRIWNRTDEATATVKAVSQYDDGGATYSVDTFVFQ